MSSFESIFDVYKAIYKDEHKKSRIHNEFPKNETITNKVFWKVCEKNYTKRFNCEICTDWNFNRWVIYFDE